MGRVVAACKLLIVCQLSLHLVKARLADDHGNRSHWDPSLPRRGAAPVGRAANRMGGRMPLPGCPQTRAARVDLASIGGIGQNAADRRLVPAVQTPRRWEPQALQMFGQTRQTGLVAQVPGEHLLDQSGFGVVPPDAGRVAWALRIDPIAIGHVRPRQQGTRLQLALPATAHPLGDQRPFVFGDGPANLQQQLVMRIMAHGSIQKFNRTAGLLEFFQQHHLVHVIARQTVRRRDQNAVQLAGLGTVPQSVQARPIQARPTIAIIPEDVLVRQAPTGLLDMGPQPLQLFVAGLGFDLVLGRHSYIQRHSHRTPPAWLRRPDPIAEGVGRPDPSAAARRGSASAAAGLATGISWGPPQ